MQLTPINSAEAIIDPFWDPRLSDFGSWNIEPGLVHGLSIEQGWCFVTFSWARSPGSDPALVMKRDVSIDCTEYDRLVLSAMAPEGSVVELEAVTDTGICGTKAPPSPAMKREIVLDLGTSRSISAVSIRIFSHGEGVEQGWLNWLGLQSSGELERYLNTMTYRNSQWDRYIRPEDFEPDFTPAYGLVLDESELNELRERHDKLVRTSATDSPFVLAGKAALEVTPEEYIHDFVNFWNDSRYNRERDHGKFILTHGLNAAIAGHILHDKKLLRHAARFAMSIATCGKWDDGFVCYFPGGDFEHRCFVQSLCAYDVAGILDLAGEYFTNLGRDFLLRRLAEEGIGSINYTVWRHEYIFDCNQLAWFTPGRMLGLAVLAKHFPRVTPQIQTAYSELCDSLDRSILADGGYVEGPTYFRCVGRDAGLGLYYYARATGKKLREVIPDAMLRCGNFAEVVSSTDESTDVIPICDARNRHEFFSSVLMSALLPESAWKSMADKSLERFGGWPAEVKPDESVGIPAMMADAAIAWNLTGDSESASAARDRKAPVFLQMPDMGPVVSTRSINKEVVKIFVQGNSAGAGHTHEDKGSFILEFAGDTFALDPGSCDYSSPIAAILKNCERHNMLIPFGTADRPHPKCPLPADIKPDASGNDDVFRADLELLPGWEKYYRRWNRKIHSPDPTSVIITDDYELLDGEGVEFYWQTLLPVTLEGDKAVITGRRGQVILTAPSELIWRLDTLPLLDGVQKRIAIRYTQTSGSFSVTAEMQTIG